MGTWHSASDHRASIRHTDWIGYPGVFKHHRLSGQLVEVWCLNDVVTGVTNVVGALLVSDKDQEILLRFVLVAVGSHLESVSLSAGSQTTVNLYSGIAATR